MEALLSSLGIPMDYAILSTVISFVFGGLAVILPETVPKKERDRVERERQEWQRSFNHSNAEIFNWDKKFDPPDPPRRLYGCRECEGYGCTQCHLCDEFNEECGYCLNLQEARIEAGEECKKHGTAYMDPPKCLECEHEKAQENKKVEDQ